MSSTSGYLILFIFLRIHHDIFTTENVNKCTVPDQFWKNLTNNAAFSTIVLPQSVVQHGRHNVIQVSNRSNTKKKEIFSESTRQIGNKLQKWCMVGPSQNRKFCFDLWNNMQRQFKFLICQIEKKSRNNLLPITHDDYETPLQTCV